MESPRRHSQDLSGPGIQQAALWAQEMRLVYEHPLRERKTAHTLHVSLPGLQMLRTLEPSLHFREAQGSN